MKRSFCFLNVSSLARLAALATAILLSACGGGGGGGSATVTTSNVVEMKVDGGPSSLAPYPTINQAYVDVKVCRPGTNVCVTIDHVLVDTGSSGLRLMDSVLKNSSLALPVITSGSNPVGECSTFISGYMWGSVNRADVTIGGKTASSIPIQIVGASGSAFNHTPSSCTSTGSDFGTVELLGANGILGVGTFKYDCDDACVSTAIPGTYYSCTSSSCSSIIMSLANQVSHPVASFTTDNNGVVLDLPAVSSSGSALVTGSLIFGIGTQSNNALGSATIYATDDLAYFTTNYQSTNMTSSFIDSGSNGLFFPDINNRFTDCSSGSFYCTTRTGSTATNTAALGSPAATGTITFDVYTLNNFDYSITAAHIGGPGDSGSFDWGLPFFYGRKVFTAIEDPSRTSSPYGYWAY